MVGVRGWVCSNMEHAKLRSGSQQNGAATPVQSPRSNASLSLEMIISSVWPDLDQDENEEFLATQPRRTASPHDYHLAIDYTAAKMLTAVMEQVRLLQGTSAQCRDESHELLAALVSVHEILQLIVGCPCLDRYQQVLVDILLHSTKAFAFVERLLCSKALPTSSHGVHKAALRMGDFACRFFHLTVRLCEDYETVRAHPCPTLAPDPPRSARLAALCNLNERIAEQWYDVVLIVLGACILLDCCRVTMTCARA